MENNFLESNSRMGQTMARILTLNKLAQRKVPEEYPKGWIVAVRGVISKKRRAKKIELEIENIAKKIPTKILSIGYDGKIKIELARQEARCIDEIREEELEAIIEKGQEWQKEIDRDLASPIVKYWHHEATAEKILATTVKGYLLPFGTQLCHYFDTLRSNKERHKMAVETIRVKTKKTREEARKTLNKIIRAAQRRIHHKEGTHQWLTCDTCQDMAQVNELVAEACVITHSDHIPRKERCAKLTEILTKMLEMVMIPKLREKSIEVILQRALSQWGGIQFTGEDNLPTIDLPKIKPGHGNMLIAHMTEFLLTTVTMANCLKWSDMGTLRAMRKALPKKIREETEQIRSARSLINYIANKFVTQPLNMTQMEVEFGSIEFPKSNFPPMDMASGLITKAEELAAVISLKKATERKSFQEKLVRDMILAKFPIPILDNCKNNMEKSGIFSYLKMRDFLTGKECTDKTPQEQRKLYELHQTPEIRISLKNMKRKAMESQPVVRVKRMKLQGTEWDGVIQTNVKKYNGEPTNEEPMDTTLNNVNVTTSVQPVLEIIEPFEELHVLITKEEIEGYQNQYIPLADLVVEKLVAMKLDWTEEGLRNEVDYQIIKHGLTVVEDWRMDGLNVGQ